MTRMRAVRILLALILGVATPTLASLGYFWMTGDPTFRPLGLSKTALDSFETERAKMDILAEVYWGQDAKASHSKPEVRRMLSQAIGAYDVDYRVNFNTTAGDKISVVYVVLGSRLGPYPISQAGRGIGPAVSALRRNIKAAELYPTG